MAQSTTERKQIEFILQMSPEKYKVIETLAQLQDLDVQSYIYDNIVEAIPALIDTIEDEKDRKQARKDWDREQTSMTSRRVIIMHCFFEVEPKQMGVIEKIAKTQEVSPGECLAYYADDAACSQTNLLREYFDGAAKMESMLKEG